MSERLINWLRSETKKERLQTDLSYALLDQQGLGRPIVTLLSQSACTAERAVGGERECRL